MPTMHPMLEFFLATRKQSEKLCAPLATEDYVVQPIADVSPPKWHLGHTTWFFEEFILKPHVKNYKTYHEDFSFVFNSYYETVGKRVVRADRGNLSRPTVAQIYSYREQVTQAIATLFDAPITEDVIALLEIGIHHEKQHQELLLTDIKYILGNNPLLPSYDDKIVEYPPDVTQTEWISIDEGVYEIGHKGDAFCYDNELGRHKVYLHDFSIRNTLVTNGEFLEFITDGGYERFDLWHAEGWDWVTSNNIKAPNYWHLVADNWQYYTLQGLQPIQLSAPLAHISFYEAFAFAQWKGLRLPTEFEWEVANDKLQWGSRWEWTESAYLPYPNYKKADGALGEYNGKFMVSQKVLRGGSIATPIKHTRHTYRNFFHPQLRWQYTGLRLVK
ncbi:ergothioneine biosynthesis protein EgtB [Croceivirga sp. JEA036]|uniref:ergothioneine biosynthesis protein EgtB n=1 Tax=Croceivirga sp. JEA036 TaxID=2721162 RepID=UPI00143ACEAC|nr:ergothioneine biosynthesis protein EgtB [Croceivirga sp. JEA036]NJB36157.1 ergothioneine biosynthesis protein EgtB [Croceivirga sp. JEA036]